MQIKVSIADDHPIVIDGLTRILSKHPRMMLLATYKDGGELLDGLAKTTPDVLLLDLQMPVHTGDELLPKLRRQYPDMRIIVLTNYDSALYANNMFKRGASGYLLKTVDHDKLIAAIDQVYVMGAFVDDEMKERIRNMDIRQRNAGFSISSLTPREREIIQLIVDGYSTSQIAEKLFLGSGTVKNYRSSIILKLDADNTATLVKKALQSGLAE